MSSRGISVLEEEDGCLIVNEREALASFLLEFVQKKFECIRYDRLVIIGKINIPGMEYRSKMYKASLRSGKWR